MRIPDTYHLYVQCAAMIPESVALEEIFRDHNIHEAAGLAYLSINHRRGHCLGGFLKKSSGNTRVCARDGINVEIMFKMMEMFLLVFLIRKIDFQGKMIFRF
jgi:hypothetical protein